MRTAESWVDVVHPAALIGAPGELERQIRRIQADAIDHAAQLLDIATPTLPRSYIRNGLLELVKQLSTHQPETSKTPNPLNPPE